MNYNDYTVGNNIKYIGPLQRFKSIGKIIEIDSLNDKESYRLLVERNQDGENEEIRAQSDDIKPIDVSKQYLLEKGFVFSEDDHIFRKDDVEIIRVTFSVPTTDIYGNKGFTMLDDRGFGIITGYISKVTTEQDLLSNVVILNTEHALQNYYLDKLGREY